MPDQPDLIPYRTSFYKEEWGFCTSHRQLEALEAAGGTYEVLIEPRLEPGTLTWGEYLHVGGESTDEVLISTHICHPSLANDNCSGSCAARPYSLASFPGGRRASPSPLRASSPSRSGRLPGSPPTRPALGRIKHGLVLSNVGDAGAPTYKRSRRVQYPHRSGRDPTCYARSGSPL